MKHKKKTDFHVVQNTEDVTDLVIDKVLAELREEDGIQEDIEEQVRQHKKNRRIRITAISTLTLVAAITIFLIIHLQTYTSARVITKYENGSDGNVNYIQFADGMLKYSKDGIALVNRKGKEAWNQPYQIKNPIVDTYYNEAAVVADKGGNTMMVLDREGLKGEIQTTLPVEKAVVSAQGIVCAVLKNDTSPKIICYDAAGNLLVELATSLTGTGYPMDVGISEDGKLLLVSYLCVQDGKLVTKVKYYNFEGEKDRIQDYEVTGDDYENIVAPSAFFMNLKTSVVVGDDRMFFYSGEGKPKLEKTVLLNKKIKSVFHSSRYVGLILKNERKAGYELCLFNASGKKVMSEEFTGDFSNVKISGNQVLMYDGKKCSVYTRTGIHKYDGELDSNILEIFPVVGVNKYIVISTNGMDVIRFVK
ncbi:MAG: hypothetical protein HFH11_09840 [Dorea sp.]|jgi:hypothetical protein|nr:hypothetical protein [Dorea sp.]